MINFHTVRWKNFLATGNYWLEVPLDKTQNTLIIGKNGSGKSTMLDAICFGLFGSPFRKVNKPTLVNSTNQKNCIVELVFSVDSHKYKIVRGINPNIFEIHKDGKLVDQETSMGNYQEYFEKYILKCNYKSFTQIVILGSASFTPFMQLKASDRREVIEDLLDIQVFSTMNTLVKKRLSSNRELCSLTKVKIDTSKEKEDMQNEHIKELQQNKAEIVKGYLREIVQLERDRPVLEQRIELDKKEKEHLEKEIVNKAKVSASITKLVQMEAQLEQTVSKHEKNSEFFQSNDTCPTCAQTIEESFKSDKLGKIAEKQTQCKDALVTIQEKLKEKRDALTHIEGIERRINVLKSSIQTNETSVKTINKNVESLKAKISEVEKRASETGKEHEKLAEIQEELQKSTQEYERLIHEKSYLEVASELFKDTGIKTKIIKQYLPIINSLTNKHLAALDFFVNFHLDETFKESIKSRHRDEFSYYSFSQGQKMRIDMALMLTWRAVAKLKNSVDTNLLILDEIFDSSLDASGADELMKILSMLEGNIFIISHRGDILQDKFSQTIRFIEQQNFSHIAQ